VTSVGPVELFIIVVLAIIVAVLVLREIGRRRK